MIRDTAIAQTAGEPAHTLDGMIDPEPWMQDALCAETDPEAFFPPKGGSSVEAKKVCASCDVRPDCLAYAIRTGQKAGIWGGLSERERKKLQRGAA